jgi:hypothetical protein
VTSSHREVFAVTARVFIPAQPLVTAEVSVATLAHSPQLALHLTVVRTTKGAWVVEIDSITTSSDTQQLALQLRLTRVSEDEPTRTRRLYAVIPERDLGIPYQRVAITTHISKWIETSDGNGCLLM